MTTVYYQHTHTSVFVGETGHIHNRMEADPPDESPTAIDCVSCEPYLVKLGWVYATEQVPLTDRQERDQERMEREGNMAVKQVAEALAESAANALATGAATKRRRTSSSKKQISAG